MPSARPELPLGAIGAVARLVLIFHTGDTLNHRHVERTMRGPNGFTYAITTEIAFGDYSPGRFGWVLADVRRLPVPVPCRGQLGLWDVPAGIAEQVIT